MADQSDKIDILSQEQRKLAAVKAADSISDLRKSILKMDGDAKTGAVTFNKYEKALHDLNAESLRDLAVTSKLAAIYAKKGKSGNALAAQLARQTGLELESETASRKSRIESLKEALDAAKKRNEIGMAARISQRLIAEQEDQSKSVAAMKIAQAKALQMSGGFGAKVWNGITQGLSASSAEHGRAAASKVGGFLGLTEDVVGSLSKVMGTFAVAAGALMMLLKGNAANMKANVAAGETQAQSMEELQNRTLAYTYAVDVAAMKSGIAADKINELNASLFETGAASRDYGTDFSVTMALVGKSLGLTDERAVRLGANIGVLGRSMQRDAVMAMVVTGKTASNLKVPFETLVEPLEALAEMAGRSGKKASDAAVQLDSMATVVEGMGNGALQAFRNMRGIDIAKFTKQFSSQVMGMSDTMLAAMRFKSGQSLSQMVTGVANAGFSGRLDAIKGLMRRFNLSKEDTGTQWKLGGIVGGDPGNITKSTEYGKFLQAAIRGKISDAEFGRKSAAFIDDQMAQRASVGQMITRGDDPTQILFSMLKTITDILSNIAGGLILPGAIGVVRGMFAPADQTLRPRSDSGYGVNAVVAKRMEVR